MLERIRRTVYDRFEEGIEIRGFLADAERKIREVSPNEGVTEEPAVSLERLVVDIGAEGAKI